MAEEISLSIAETNKLRAQLGLKLLPETEPEPQIQQEVQPKVQSVVQSSTELSIEETNRLRLSLGLKPITVEKPVNQTPQTEVSKPKEETKVDGTSSNDRIRQRIQDAKTKATKRRKIIDLENSLQDDSESTDDWLNKLGSKKKTDGKVRRKVEPSHQENELEELSIGHNVNELSKLSNDDILTFDDSNILADDDNGKLTNEKLSKESRLKQELKNKTKIENMKHFGRHYKIEDEVEEDQDVQDLNTDSVVLGIGGTVSLAKNKVEPIANDTDKVRSKSLAISDLFGEDDELNTTDIVPSKPKSTKMKKLKKKTGNSRTKSVDVIPNGQMEAVNLEMDGVDTFEDDSELQAILQSKRKIKQRESRRNISPDQVAKEISMFQRLEEESKIDRDARLASAEEGSVVFDDTTDFLSSLSAPILKEPTVPVELEQIKEDVTEKQEALDSVTSNDKKSEEIDLEKKVEPILEQPSEVFNKGLASTLKFLQSQSIISKPTTESSLRAREYREAQREAELLKLKISIEERLLREELASDKQYMNTPKVEREELFGQYLDQRLKEKQIIQPNTHSRVNNKDKNKLKSYNPDVKLTYRDDQGNVLNTKEAYKVLSHKFHGVMPSAAQASKKAKKLESNKSQTGREFIP
ncbi:66 kDa U4/U6.U5 small nuclear ribonucleoprotein component [[Candida] anglica]|uniref:66 kDa U4/U6.U5 small nuclear ribonucleoprotein component n=1 Tax=[Candida] anglica TaxID=148631 RepID=A0ABP0E6S8_9ASCO